MADNPFEAAWKAANPAFFSTFGRDGGLSYKPAAESAYTISAIPVDEKPVPRFAPNGTHEFDEWRWKISSESNVLGRIDVKIMGFKGQPGDKILSLDGRDWFIVYRDAGNDPGMQIITLRDKGVPWDYDNE